ncbi:MAG: cupin domain-containing protein [Betaproteobacteria bacterium]
MHELGRLEDLPQDYRDELAARNLVPLWPNLRNVLPPRVPSRNTRPIHWPYATLRPLLLRAGELTPMEKAERRVLVLANPGHGLEAMKASPAMYLGMQLLLPGEWAPAHRHTPNAVRMVVEGRGATTTVSGEKCPMERGDLILTPTGEWHEHEHDGQDPVVWLDVLDLPLMFYAEVSYAVEGARQPVKPGRGDQAYAHGGIVPTPVFERGGSAYPMLRYPWAQARAALVGLAASQPDLEAVQVTYVNPETGRDAQNNLGFHALMLRPGQVLRLPARSPSQVFHVIEGGADVGVAGSAFALAEADTCCAPGYEAVTLGNRSATEPAFLFVADESPLHRKLGVYETRA